VVIKYTAYMLDTLPVLAYISSCDLPSQNTKDVSDHFYAYFRREGTEAQRSAVLARYHQAQFRSEPSATPELVG
jgi:hypothetical protein